MFYAHSPNGQGGEGVWEPMRDHLKFVAETASSFAKAFGAEGQVHGAALLHDLGKYSNQFQRRLRDRSEPGRDHWTLGAIAALMRGNQCGFFPAVAILGHHVGLESIGQSLHALKTELADQRLENHPDRFTTSTLEHRQSAIKAFMADGFEIPHFESGLRKRGDYAGDMLDTRMLFSALVDADFLETEAHFAGNVASPRCPRAPGRSLPTEALLESLNAYLECFDRNSARPIDHIRRNLMADCRSAGRESTGRVFTLSAPTGAGKTLAMLAFALERARSHGLRRIVLVMPFLNIIDQTAAIYREVFPPKQFGEDLLLEAHSLAGRDVGMHDDDGADATEIRRRLLSENWDAPIVLTTNVQLLESLHAAKPGRCRKLHRLAESVILFDEVQTLPAKLAIATLATLNRLSDPDGPYRTTVVFATATQPAFESLAGRLREMVDAKNIQGKPPGWAPAEIAQNTSKMFGIAANRVQIEWREKEPISFRKLAGQLADHGQILCIVNLKRHAIELAETLSSLVSDVFHLSTNMCSEHRLAILSSVRKRLESGEPVRLVATQCVEAGVDIDFPVVYRAFAPLEAIAQAAGRCNRNGNLPTSRVIVFTPADPDDVGQSRRIYPPGYDFAVSVTHAFLGALRHEHTALPEVINDPARMRDYYRMLYSVGGRSESEQPDERGLLNAIKAGFFPDVAKEYCLIDQAVINVLVPYERETFESLESAANQSGRLTAGEIRRWIKLARPHAVSLYRPRDENDDLYAQLLPIHFGLGNDEQRGPTTREIDWWVPGSDRCYDHQIGLRLAEPQWVM